MCDKFRLYILCRCSYKYNLQSFAHSDRRVHTGLVGILKPHRVITEYVQMMLLALEATH